MYEKIEVSSLNTSERKQLAKFYHQRHIAVWREVRRLYLLDPDNLMSEYKLEAFNELGYPPVKVYCYGCEMDKRRCISCLFQVNRELHCLDGLYRKLITVNKHNIKESINIINQIINFPIKKEYL